MSFVRKEQKGYSAANISKHANLALYQLKYTEKKSSHSSLMARSKITRSCAMFLVLPLLLLLTPTAHAKSSPLGHLWSRQEGTAEEAPIDGGGDGATTEIRVRNNCAETIWPGIGNQAGIGPDTNGFELASGSVRTITVSDNWQGRIWGRTNCSFNEDGTRSANGQPAACGTGDCFGVLNCVQTVRLMPLRKQLCETQETNKKQGATPVTLFEMALKAGTNNDQSFYDISLVDGYNLPMGLTYTGGGTGLDLPPNLVNCACVASVNQPVAASDMGNASYPVPRVDIPAGELSSWCPWDHQQNPPTKPGDGVYPYPDDDIKRPDFSPCLSECAKTNSEESCCAGRYNDPNVCKPGPYATQAKVVCPDAYSFAFDDQQSTFIVPSGGGWELAFCPGVASTKIISTFPQELADLGQGRFPTTAPSMQQLQTWDTVEVKSAAGAQLAAVENERVGSLGALVVMLAFVCLW